MIPDKKLCHEYPCQPVNDSAEDESTCVPEFIADRFYTILQVLLVLEEHRSPTIQVDILKHESAVFPLKNPALITIPLSFAVGMVVALLWPEPEADARFAEVEQRIHATGPR